MVQPPLLLGSSLILRNNKILLLGGSKLEEKNLVVNQDVYNLQLGKGLKQVNWKLENNKLDIGSSNLVQFGRDSFVSLSTGIEAIDLNNFGLEPDENKDLEQGAWALYIMDQDINKFDLKETPDTPPILNGYSICTVPGSQFGSLIVYGGYDLKAKKLNNNIYAFDVGTKVWKKLDFKNTTPYRYLHSVFCQDNFMYVIGGTNLTHTTGLGSLDIFDLDKLSWSTEKLKGLPPKPRFLSSIVKIKDEAVFMGGIDSQKEVYNDIFRLDLKSFSWVRQSNNDKKLSQKLGYNFGSAATLINDTTLVFKLGWDKLNINNRRGLQRRDDANGADDKLFFLDVESYYWNLLDFQTVSSRFPQVANLPNNNLESSFTPQSKETKNSDNAISTVTLVCSIVFSLLFLLLLIVIVLYFIRKRYAKNKQNASDQPLMQRSTTVMQYLDTIHEVDEVSYSSEPMTRENTGFKSHEGEIYPSALMEPLDEEDEEESVHIGETPQPIPVSNSTTDLLNQADGQDPMYDTELFDPNEILNENSFYNTGASLPSTADHSKVLNLKATSTIRKPNYDTCMSDGDISILDVNQNDMHQTRMS